MARHPRRRSEPVGEPRSAAARRPDGWAFLTGAPEVAKVGDCLTGGAAEDVTIVGCTDSTAQDKAVGRVEGKTEAEFNETDVETLCAGMPSVKSALWQGQEGGKGFVLCLEPVG